MARMSAARARRLFLPAVAAAALAMPAAAIAAAGELDPSFGTGGVVASVLGTGASARAIVLQPDGRIVAAADVSGDFAVVRYLPDGSLDPSFGTGGVAAIDLGGFDAADAVALQPDGRIVAAGISWPAGAVVVRFDSDGSVDTGFGAGGRVDVPFAGGGGQLWKVVVQPDGKLVVVGSSGMPSRFAIARLLPDGSLDPGFGDGGTVLTPFSAPAGANGAVLQPDGKLVVSGGGQDFALARYLPDGTLDASFGAGGTVTTDVGPGYESAVAVALKDGRIVVAGYASVAGGVFALARYEEDGALDPSFGSGGVAASPFAVPANGFGLAVAPGGALLVAGGAVLDGTTSFALASYTRDGLLDAGFGTGGVVTTSFGAGVLSNALDVAVQPDGRIVVGGLAWTAPGSAVALARYLGGPDAAALIEALRARVRSDGIGPGSSLPDKLAAAHAALPDTGEACSILRAFDHEVAGQTGRHVDAAAAPGVLAASAQIEAALGCD